MELDNYLDQLEKEVREEKKVVDRVCGDSMKIVKLVNEIDLLREDGCISEECASAIRSFLEIELLSYKEKLNELRSQSEKRTKELIGLYGTLCINSTI